MPLVWLDFFNSLLFFEHFDNGFRRGVIHPQFPRNLINSELRDDDNNVEWSYIYEFVFFYEKPCDDLVPGFVTDVLILEF